MMLKSNRGSSRRWRKSSIVWPVASAICSLIATTSTEPVLAFSLIPIARNHAHLSSSSLWSSETTDRSSSLDPSEMKLREIQAELKEMGVSFADCFDRESLTRRLIQAREQGPTISTKSSDTASQSDSAQQTTAKADAKSNFDRESKLKELRSMRVKELREECGKCKIRWARFVEKEDFVQALLHRYEMAQDFSRSGAIVPGEVADLTGDELALEVSSEASTMLLLDVYATWCGPCRMLVPQLAQAAEELGDSVRVAKLDSDKYQDWASRLKVGGLPTLILFDSHGKEINRVEGALMKDGLLQMVQEHL